MEPSGRGSRDRWAYLAIPLAVVLFHVATARGYGIFRDELYYLACADHLDWGYVDQPPLSLALLAGVRAALGDSLHAIRLPAALAGGATALLAAATARVFGGGAFAQRLAALCSGFAPATMALAGFYSMNALDLVFWIACSRIAAGLLAGRDPRGWLAFGAVAGLGLQNKISVLFLGFGVAVGIVAARRRDVLRSPWFWLGGIVSGALFLPHLAWQAANGWPTPEFMENARRLKMAAESPAGFLGEQILFGGPLALPVWLAGVVFLLARPEGKPWRALGWAFLAVVAVLIGTGGKSYYLAPAYPLLFAAGGAAWERWSAGPRARALRIALPALALAGSAVVAPFTKAILPVETFIRYAGALRIAPSSGERNAVGRLPQHFADMHGWRELAGTVAAVHESLPPAERAVTCVAAQNYGEAGAIDYFGPALGLPKAVSGHNSYFLWGPRDCGREIWIVVGDDRETLETIFESVELAATFDCDLCMPYEDDNPIWVCRRMKTDPRELWPRVKHYI